MAFSIDTNPTMAAASASAGSTLAMSVTGANIGVGKLAILVIAKDNVQTTDGQTSEVTSITDTNGGNTWTKAGEFCNGQGSAAAGAVVSIWYSVIAGQINAGASAITVNFSSSITAKAVTGRVFSQGGSVSVAAGSLQTLATDGGDPGSVSISGLANKEYLFIWGNASESSTTTDASGTNYTSFGTAASSTSASGGSAANMGARALYRILTGTGDTLDATLFSADHATVFVAFQEPTVFIARKPLVIGRAVPRATLY